MKSVYKYTLILAGICIIVTIIMLLMGYKAEVGPPVVIGLLAMAIGFRGHEFLRKLSYSVIIFSSVSASLFYPQYFTYWGDFNLSLLIVPLLQIIMFGMGTAMSFKDFVGVIRMPKAVGVGLISDRYCIHTRPVDIQDRVIVTICILSPCTTGQH